MPAIEEQCPMCKKFFSTHPKAPHQVYCSKQCSSKIDREKHRVQIRETKKKWREKNLEKVKRTQKKYYQENKEKISQRAREWEKENIEHVRELKRDWYAKHKDDSDFLEGRRASALKSYLKKKGGDPDFWKKRYTLDEIFHQKVTARHLAKQAFKEGKIKRQGCKTCGKFAEMHHPDYSKPLEVEWLCHECHMQLHNQS